MNLDRETLLSLILDAVPHPVVFVDTEHIIRYLNEPARRHYHEERGYEPLIGKSIFACHSEQSNMQIRQLVERLHVTGEEIPLHADGRVERAFITPVLDGEGRLIGYFERFEALNGDG